MPSIPVANLQDSIDFYTSKLPFRLYGRDSENHCWLGTHDAAEDGSRGGSVNFYLRLKGFQGPHKPVKDEKLGQGKIYIRLEGDKVEGGDPNSERSREEKIKSLFEVLKQREAKVDEVLRMPWGQYQFTCLDLDGNQIVFYA